MDAEDCGKQAEEAKAISLSKEPSFPIAQVDAQMEVLHSEQVDPQVYPVQNATDLQSTIRSYLDRKQLRRVQEEMLVFEDDGTESADYNTDCVVESFLALLSEYARNTYGRISIYVMDRQVRDVISREPKKLNATGDIYIGQWAVRADGIPVRKGKGRLISPSGALFEGYWKNGHLHSKGRIIYQNGDYYEGPFDNGMRVGQGRFETYERKTTYIGAWENDVRHGYGIETFDDGARYEGDFKEDKKTGKGKLSYEYGSYEGDFIEGRLDGEGVYKWSDGREYRGSWKDGKMYGRGKFTYPEGKSYEGEYVNDKKQGFGVYKWDDKEYAGEWFEGQMHGFGYLTNAEGKKRYQFENGVRIRRAPE